MLVRQQRISGWLEAFLSRAFQDVRTALDVSCKQSPKSKCDETRVTQVLSLINVAYSEI